jgi:ribonuclease HII
VRLDYACVGRSAQRRVDSLGGEDFGVYDGWDFVEAMMAKKDRLTRVAVGIGKAMGKADRKAQQVARAGVVAKEELEEIAKQVESLKRQLQKTTKRLKAALR